MAKKKTNKDAPQVPLYRRHLSWQRNAAPVEKADADASADAPSEQESVPARRPKRS